MQQLGRLSDICSIWSWTVWACKVWTSAIPAGHFSSVITFTLNTLPINLYIYHGGISQQDQVQVPLAFKLKEHVLVLLSCFCFSVNVVYSHGWKVLLFTYIYSWSSGFKHFKRIWSKYTRVYKPRLFHYIWFYRKFETGQMFLHSDL